MPHITTNSIEQPNEDAKIWRYMDFTKLLWMIENDQIYMRRADSFEDPFEGALPFVNNLINDNSISWNMKGMPYEICNKCVYLSCWHINKNNRPQCGTYI